MSDTKPIDSPDADGAPATKVAVPDVELTDADLGQVSGGMVPAPPAAARKTKSADTASTATDTFVRG